MKIMYALLIMLTCTHLFACSKDGNAQPETNTIDTPTIPNTDTTKMKITIGSTVFTATFSNNATAAAFRARLPLTIPMADLNANEKHVDLSNSLPANSANPGTIQVGDLMLYGSNTLVLFYKSFTTQYSYTRIGRIDDVSGLTAALGSGNVTVTFALR
jgi:hypothetical protein